jgi:hypothetical protein
MCVVIETMRRQVILGRSNMRKFYKTKMLLLAVGIIFFETSSFGASDDSVETVAAALLESSVSELRAQREEFVQECNRLESEHTDWLQECWKKQSWFADKLLELDKDIADRSFAVRKGIADKFQSPCGRYAALCSKSLCETTKQLQALREMHDVQRQEQELYIRPVEDHTPDDSGHSDERQERVTRFSAFKYAASQAFEQKTASDGEMLKQDATDERQKLKQEHDAQLHDLERERETQLHDLEREREVQLKRLRAELNNFGKEQQEKIRNRDRDIDGQRRELERKYDALLRELRPKVNCWKKGSEELEHALNGEYAALLQSFDNLAITQRRIFESELEMATIATRFR